MLPIGTTVTCEVCNKTYNNVIGKLSCCRKDARKELQRIEHKYRVLPHKLWDVASYSKLIEEFIKELPTNITSIVGVARSGMIPASIMSTLLGTRLYSINQYTGEIQSLGGGHRIRSIESDQLLDDGVTLLIDDTTYSGNSLINSKQFMIAAGIEPITAAVIGSPLTHKGIVDYCYGVTDIHLFEWNITHAPWSNELMFDIDGLFCRDFTTEEDIDDRRYAETMKTMVPTHWRSKKPLNFLTARPEQYRQLTLDWFESINQPVASLTMWEGNKQERDQIDIAEWKAAKMTELGFSTLIESSDYIAKKVNKIAGFQTASIETRIVYPRYAPPKPVTTWSHTDCVHLGEKIGEIECGTCPSTIVIDDVHQCHLHNVPCSRVGSLNKHKRKRGFLDLRSCVECYGLDEGFKRKEPKE